MYFQETGLLKNLHGLIIAFDKGKRQSFNDVKKCFERFRKYTQENILNRPRNIPVILLGFITNQEEITTLEGEKLAQELLMFYFETRSIDKEQIYNIYRFIYGKYIGIEEKENISL